jgi:8-oxo-dGTP pyrophosphatase MutT (NUDIX family)
MDCGRFQKMKKAAVVVILNNDRVLSVTRKGYMGDDPKNNALVGLPGGKVDEGETFLDAALRETFEETNICLDMDSVTFLDEQVVKGDEDFLVHTFLTTQQVDGAKQREPELFLNWLTPQEYLARSHAPDHILLIFDKLGISYVNEKIESESETISNTM